jgi:hypothetical protein
MASSSEPTRAPEPRREDLEQSHNERPRPAEEEPKFVIKLATPIPG